MKSIQLLLCLLVLAAALAAQDKPEATEFYFPVPPVVASGQTMNTPPSDAIVLFDGTTTNEWAHQDRSAVKWTIEDGKNLVVEAGTGEIVSRREFGDIQLHLEFRTPAKVAGDGQNRGNSGVFLQGRYELQILDNYENKTYTNGQVGSVYKQSVPLANPSRRPGEWQTYDIVFTAPRFNDDGIRIAPGYVTALLNGVLVQNHTMILGTTEYIGQPKNIAHGKAPLILQDHGNPTAFRNIWVREL